MAAMLRCALAVVLDDCVTGELGEVGVSVGLRREVKVAVDEFPGVGHGFFLLGGRVRWWGACRPIGMPPREPMTRCRAAPVSMPAPRAMRPISPSAPSV